MEVNEGEQIVLANQTVDVVKCEKCGHLMANIDADQVQPGDLWALKSSKVRLSNPTTEEQICLKCEFTPQRSFLQKVGDWFEEESDDHNDSGFFSAPSTFSSGESQEPSSGGFSLPSFGGGIFSGGGASRTF